MRQSNIYIYSGELVTKLEGSAGLLLDYHIEDCYTKHVINRGANTLIGLYIKKGYVKYKQILSSGWNKKDVSGEIIYIAEHNWDINSMSCQSLDVDVPFYSWEFNRFKVELNEQAEILNIEYDKELLEGLFIRGFEDALVNKPRLKLSGALLNAYSNGYNLCNKTNGDMSELKK